VTERRCVAQDRSEAALCSRSHRHLPGASSDCLRCWMRRRRRQHHHNNSRHAGRHLHVNRERDIGRSNTQHICHADGELNRLEVRVCNDRRLLPAQATPCKLLTYLRA
jgi:hypothetical protein